MQSVGPIVFLSSSVKSDNHTNGHVNRRNENKKKIKKKTELYVCTECFNFGFESN